ncbi:MAG: hypothetical protein KKF85_15290 [Gammaproteobacteria bacterium]|nr:hypothetical protein [Rhodocyclaceae bacterium]MBU3907969.1 hypothetical protein [Gammaproteobacteria bacterium]MBU3988163.1 hypothetical protein [Gammaproteobacteria bacterium]MBU4003875.1 hypothetical protein [Gammaproteobacteria bacterium]MBU4021753.1 hypothetical protein [Gammaproteobacteria bacterium]
MHFSRAFKTRSLRWLPVFAFICWVGYGAGQSFATEPDVSAVALRAKFAALGKQLRNNQFQRALHLDSAESAEDLQGEIHAVVNYPFAAVNVALNNPAHWCDVLILHVNIKYCHVSSNMAGAVLTVNIGRKYDQPLADTYRVEFNYRGAIATPDYFAVELNAANGPLDTHDYRIRLEATPLEDGRSFLHFTYTYAFGLTGRLAMQGYLATIGRDKVGFTITGKQPNGQPTYIQGVRGVVERNTMRYYLAIDAYLAALATPPRDQLEIRLQHWYNGTEQYARQLHEVERDDYLAMKRKEYQRQQVAR